MLLLYKALWLNIMSKFLFIYATSPSNSLDSSGIILKSKKFLNCDSNKCIIVSILFDVFHSNGVVCLLKFNSLSIISVIPST